MYRLIRVATACRPRSRCVLLALLLCVLTAVPIQAASADSDSWTAIPGTTVEGVSLVDTYCFPGTSRCIAVGSEGSPAVGSSAVVESNASGVWQAVPSGTPAPGAFYASDLNSVSCASASFCVAVGEAQSNGTSQQPAVAVFDGTDWTFQQLSVGGPGSGYGLSSVSCVSTSDCVAVGGEGTNSMIIETFDGTGWTPTLQTGEGASPADRSTLNGVSCADAADCMAVGYYATDLDGDLQGFAEVFSAGTWTYAATPALPSSNALFAVDCSSSDCVAVGDQNFDTDTLVENYAGGVWSVADASVSGTLRSVSCPAPDDCAAAGIDTSFDPVVMTSLDGTWSSGPVASPISQTYTFGGVSCASVTFCVAPGWGVDSSNDLVGYLMSGGILHVPGPPLGLIATPGPGSATLSWSAPASDGGSPVTGYDVFMGTGSGGESTTPLNPAPITGASFTVTGLGAGPVFFTVEAVNAIGPSAPSNEVMISSSTTTLSAAPGFSVSGQAVTFTATVASGTLDVGPPTGTVIFTVDGTARPAVSVAGGGTASLSLSSLAPGPHTVGAAYSGDGTFGGGSATPLSYTVDQAATTVTLTPSTDPSQLGGPGTVTATIAPVSPGAGIPTGTVAFTVDGTAQTPVPLTAGMATLDVSALTAGSHTITAAYSGDTDFTSSVATLTQTVQASASVTLTSSVSPSVYGQPVTITTVVSPISPETASPTGSITFSVDGNPGTAVTLANGAATLPLPSLSSGSHSVTAAYSGDAVFAASSSTFTQTVSQDATTTALTSSANPATAGQAVTFTAAVAAAAPGGGTPTGTVVFTVNGVPQPATALSEGAAALSLSALAPGSYTVTAAYSGDADFTSSTSPTLSQSIQQETTTTLTVSPPNAAVAGGTVTLTATEAPATSGSVQFFDGTTPLSPPVAVSSAAATYPTQALAVGTHQLSATFTPSAPGYVPSNSANVSYQVSAPALAVDQTITQNGNGKITTASFSTAGPRLLIAFVSSDGPAAKQSATVTGAGLTWTLVRRANTEGGTAEIWSATAAAPLINATITATPKTTGFDESLTVIAFSAAGGIGASTTAGKAKGAPSVALTTTAPGSWVFGVGEDYTGALARTPAAGQSIITQWVDPGPGETFWVQNESSLTPTSGTTVTLTDTAPVGDEWNFAAVEILAADP